MKQRLLLALLVLFAAAGMVKAAANTVGLKIKPNSGEVKITYTGDAPTIASLSAKNNVFTIANSSTEQSITINLATGTSGLTFAGNMNELEMDGDNLTAISFGSNSTLKKLTVTSADGLTNLNCSNLGLTELTLTSLSNLKSLDCSHNQLTSLELSNIQATTIDCSNNQIATITPNSNVEYVAFKCAGNKLISEISNLDMAGTAKPDYGYQIITIKSASGSTDLDATANQLYDIVARATGADGNLSSISGNNYTWGKQWKKKKKDAPATTTIDSYETSSDAHADNTYTTQFTFYNSGKYQSGDYIFSVEPKATASSTMKYWVELKVKPAALQILLQQPDKIDSNRGGTLTISEVDGTASQTQTTDISEADGKTLSATQGKLYRFSATPASGFAFKKFDISDNADGFSLKNSDLSAGMETYELVGLTKYPKELKVKPVFEPKSYTIIYKGDQINGKYTIRVKNGQAFENGKGTATYGQTVVINAQPNAGYEAYVTIGTEAQQKMTAPVEYTITSDVNIAITFKKKETELNISADRTAGIFGQVQLNETGLNAISGGGSGTWQAKATPNTTAVLKLTMTEASSKTTSVSDILFNGQSLPIVKGVTTDGKTTYTASFDVPAEGENYSVVIKTVTRTAATITPKPNAEQIFTYDGNAKTLRYTTNPANLDKIKIEYSVNTVATEAAAQAYTGPWTEKAPVNAGKYAVKASREADNVYQTATFASTDSKPVLLTINKAKATIKTLPSVSIKNTNGLLTYSISGGEAVLGTTKVTGKFEVVNDGTTDIDNKQVVNKAIAHTAKVAFFAQTTSGASDPNFVTDRASAPSAQIAVKGTDGKSVDNYQVKMNVPESSGITVMLKNGENFLNASASATASATVPSGTTLTFVIYNPKGWKITKLTEIADNTPEVIDESIVGSGGKTGKTQSYTMTTGVAHAMNILVNAEAVADNRKEYTVSLEDYVVAYKDGEAIPFGDEGKAKITVKEKNDATKTVISYKNSQGKTIALPVEADTYIVEVKIDGTTINSGDYAGTYKDRYVQAKMIVTPRELKAAETLGKGVDLVFPTKSSPVGLGQKLQQSTFEGGATRVAGSFAWETPTEEAKNGTSYQVIFKPADTKNYTILDKGPKIQVTVSNKQLVTYGNPANGKIVVKDEKGGIYLSGDEVTGGTKLIITAVPDNEFALGTLVINDETISVSGDSYTYTVPKDKSVAIEATFKVKAPEVDPNTQYTVTLPKAGTVKGVVIGKPGINAVTKGGSFTFTFSSLAADAKNIVVKVDGTTLAPVDGKYTIAKVDGNKVVTVTLSNPTKIKVSVEKETKNAKGYVMGKVEVEGLAKDSTCYYGDEVTLVAFPESGVTFTGWSGAITGTDKLATFTVKQPMTIKPKFTGVPTGIETIQDTRIYGREGHIFIGCDGEAKVTLISMDGRVKKVEISGDTRIEMAAGIYGVVVEKGSDRMQTKVIVR